MLNMLYFLPMTFFGIYFWSKNTKQREEKKRVIVRNLSWKEKIVWFGSSIVVFTIYGFLLKFLNGTLPFIDSSTTVFSIIATILLTKRVTDQWFYWIMVDILSVVMWVYIFVMKQGDVSMLVMWSAYLVNAVYGYYNWRKMEKKQHG